MNELKHLDAFRKVLATYQPSEVAQEVLRHIPLVLLVGISGSGRNTVIDALLNASNDYRFIVSDTTRQPRINKGIPEVNGREYWFRSEDEVLHELNTGQFLEAAIIHGQQVSGISIRELQIAQETQKIAINEVEVVGAAHIHAIKPNTVIIFVVPPSFDVWLKRLHGRGVLPQAELHRRLESACHELAIALKHDYYHFVINDSLETTVVAVDTLAHTTASDSENQQRARILVQQLLLHIQDYLRQHTQ